MSERDNRATGAPVTAVDILMALLSLCAIFGLCAFCVGVGIKALRWGLA